MHHGPLETIELVLAMFGVALAASYLARRLRVAEPIMLLLGGLGLGLALEWAVGAGLLAERPEVGLAPDVVFLLFLPPILFAAAYFTPIRDFRANARAILLLAIGLVLFTTVVVALVANAVVPGLGLAAAFTLGAIVAPPDAVAATAIFQRLGVPRRIVTILEGESLINDASSLIAYRAASAVALGVATFSITGSTLDFVVIGVGGLVVGAILGMVLARALTLTADPILEIVLTLLAPTTSYLVAEELGFSGVLATVVAGLITGRRAARVLSPQARVLGLGAWRTVIWVINAFVFLLIGLQLPSILAGLQDIPPATLLWYGSVVSLTVIVARFAWVFPATYLPRYLSPRLRAREPVPSPRAIAIVSWAGMRGVVSLAAALALSPDFPQRPLILFLTFCVILATLVGQGLTLPLLIRRLGVTAVVGPRESEEVHARLAAVEAALIRSEELRLEFPQHGPLLDSIRDALEHEATHVLPTSNGTLTEAEQEALDHRAIRSAILVAQRDAVIDLRDQGVINDETLRAIERDLDFEVLRAGD
jgi:Na+/H+ antiporter